MATKKKAAKKKTAPAKKPKAKKSKPLTMAALAKALKVSPKTVRLLRRTQGAPEENDLEAWQRYMMERASASDKTMQVADAFMPDDIRQLRAKLLRAQAGKEDAMRRLKELELEQKEKGLVPMSDARKAVKRGLAPLRELLDQMPKAAGAKVNPADPIHGEEGIREHLEGIFQTMERDFSDE